MIVSSVVAPEIAGSTTIDRIDCASWFANYLKLQSANLEPRLTIQATVAQ
jgi:hypothetical protein